VSPNFPTKTNSSLILRTLRLTRKSKQLLFSKHTPISIDRKEKTILLNLYPKLPTQNQLLIKAIANPQKQGNPTTQAITLEYQKLSQTHTSERWITQKLAEADNIGLIKQTLKNQNDNPALAWNSQIPQKTLLLKWLKT